MAKHWYIIHDNHKQQCDFVYIYQLKRTIYLKYMGIDVKVVLNDLSDIKQAIDGNIVDATAVSTQSKKEIKIVFE